MRRTESERGFTILEVLIAAVVIAVGLLGLMSTISNSLQLSQTSRETQIATTAAQNKVEEIRDLAQSTTTFAIVMTTFANQTFDVDGLAPMPSNLKAHGVVTFLSEPEAAAAFGLASVDLNGNGVTTDSPDLTFKAY
ncbi:MAG: type IV pilus modification PilV family protein, partial [Polyangiaceae bacterium]